MTSIPLLPSHHSFVTPPTFVPYGQFEKAWFIALPDLIGSVLDEVAVDGQPDTPASCSINSVSICPKGGVGL